MVPRYQWRLVFRGAGFSGPVDAGECSEFSGFDQVSKHMEKPGGTFSLTSFKKNETGQSVRGEPGGSPLHGGKVETQANRD